MAGSQPKNFPDPCIDGADLLVSIRKLLRRRSEGLPNDNDFVDCGVVGRTQSFNSVISSGVRMRTDMRTDALLAAVTIWKLYVHAIERMKAHK